MSLDKHQAWLPETDWDHDTRQLVRVNPPRAMEISRRLERAVNMNLTAWHAALQIQVLWDFYILRSKARRFF